MPVYREKETKNGKRINKVINDKQQWYIRTYVNGKQVTRRNKAWLGKRGYDLAVEEELKLKSQGVIINKKIYFQDLIDVYKEEIMKTTKESSYYSYFNVINNQILPHISPKCEANKINSIDSCRKWHNVLEKKGLSIEYMNKCHHVMKAILDIGIKYFNMKQNCESLIGPFKRTNQKIISDEEKIKYITYEDFQKFISLVDDLVWKTFFTFLYYTGMRKGEVQALTWKDIDFKNNEITVNKTLSTKINKDNTIEISTEQYVNYKITTTKNNLNRKIKMSKVLKEQLIQYKKNESSKQDFCEKWFVFGRNRFLPHITIDRKKHYYFNLSNVKEITIHEFRHSHVSLLINEYLKSGQTDTAKFFVMMSNRMGHTIQVMQNTYMHLFPTIQDEIVEMLDNL